MSNFNDVWESAGMSGDHANGDLSIAKFQSVGEPYQTASSGTCYNDSTESCEEDSLSEDSSDDKPIKHLAKPSIVKKTSSENQVKVLKKRGRPPGSKNKHPRLIVPICKARISSSGKRRGRPPGSKNKKGKDIRGSTVVTTFSKTTKIVIKQHELKREPVIHVEKVTIGVEPESDHNMITRSLSSRRKKQQLEEPVEPIKEVRKEQSSIDTETRDMPELDNLKSSSPPLCSSPTTLLEAELFSTNETETNLRDTFSSRLDAFISKNVVLCK